MIPRTGANSVGPCITVQSMWRRRLFSQISLKGVNTLLDLGGGPGTYALEFLKQHPSLQATVADRAPALEVAREIAASVKHGRRLSYLPLDFLQDEIKSL